jgi:putative membrane protein
MDKNPEQFTFFEDSSISAIWSVTSLTLGVLIGFRINIAYARFWEGITLVQMMRAEWFETCSNLIAFSTVALDRDPRRRDVFRKVETFQSLLVRLMSLMHGMALRQIGGNVEDFPVIDVHGLDDESLTYLAQAESRDENCVQILLHWIQVLITDGIGDGVMCIQAPILTRAYQTLSRGMVNLHNAKKLADVPVPFPLSQLHVLLIWVQCMIAPIAVAAMMPNMWVAGFICFIPNFGSWCLLFISGQCEQPFGNDPNDLALSIMQFEMNSSLMMLLDPESIRAPFLKDSARRHVQDLRQLIGDPDSTTCKDKLLLRIDDGNETLREMKTKLLLRKDTLHSPRLNKSSSLVLRRRLEKARRSYRGDCDESSVTSEVTYLSDVTSCAANLQRKITPPWLNDDIMSESTEVGQTSAHMHSNHRNKEASQKSHGFTPVQDGSADSPPGADKKDVTGSLSHQHPSKHHRAAPANGQLHPPRNGRRKLSEDFRHGVTQSSDRPSIICRPQTPRCHSPGTSPRRAHHADAR